MQKQDQTHNTTVALIVAAGSGVRAGSAQGKPKQYAMVGGMPVLRRTLSVFSEHPRIDRILVVIRAGDEGHYEDAVTGLSPVKLAQPVTGGSTRQSSVAAGLEALARFNPSAVLIHDAARPFVTADCIDGTLDALRECDGAITASPVTDTLKRGNGALIDQTVAREHLWRAQTPQTFRFDKILEAHRAAARAAPSNFTDDASIGEWFGLRVALVEGGTGNMKITTADDLALADLIASGPRVAPAFPDVRSGTGFDVHAFEAGNHVTLCGISIPHSHGLKAHSDGDVGLHALTDALLGTIGAGDIGDHFPPSDQKWRAADSAIFLAHAALLIRERGGVVTNVDITLICERPKIGPHRDAMRARMAELLRIDLDRVSVKATTSEGLGFTGRGEGIAAMATATVILPPLSR